MQPDSMRLISRQEGHAEWMSPMELTESGQSFMDVTDHPDLDQMAAEIQSIHSLVDFPKQLHHKQLVKTLLAGVSTERMRDRLTDLTSFQNRYYRSKTGVKAAEWVESTISQILEDAGIKTGVSVTRFQHSWPQFSLIVRFEATAPSAATSDKNAPVTIVGSHMDTVRGSFFGEGRAPGADDDGSGTVTNLETLTLVAKALGEGQVRLASPLEFHYYAAEEVGLRGSQDVAASYQRDRRLVKSMLQLDMTGWRGKADAMGLIMDYTDSKSTSFLRMVMQEYTDREIRESRCGYGCSDHASWTKAGYRSAFPFEGLFEESSPYIHKKTDTIDHIDFEHMSSFVRAAVGYAIELSSQE